MQSGFVQVDGAQLYYETAGSGHPLVFVHAGIADRRMWDAQFEVFARRYRAIRFDMRGFGKSPMVDGPFSRAGDLRAVLDALAVERAHLIGCSMGGRTCIDFTLAYPDRVTALVAVCSALSGFDPTIAWSPEVIAAFDAAEAAGDLDALNALEVGIWVDGPRRTPEQVDPAVRALVADMNRIALATELGGLGDEQEPERPAAGRLGEITVPTLLIVGLLDQPRTLETSRALSSGIPHARQVEMQTAHLPGMEQPDAFNRHVLDFLASVDQPA